MKTTVTFFVLVAMGMLTEVHHANASQLEGLWTNTRTGITIEVRDIYDGIKVKRTDQSLWRYYSEQYNGEFSDPQGNTYTFSGRDELSWRARNGRDPLHFVRDWSNSERPYYDDYNNGYINDDNYIDNDDYLIDDYGFGGRYDGAYCPNGYSNHGGHKHLSKSQTRKLRRIEGNWTNNRTNQFMAIRVNRDAIHVDFGRTHMHFYPTGHGHFVSDSGVTMHVTGRNKIIWQSRRGRTLIFNRGRFNNRYCD